MDEQQAINQLKRGDINGLVTLVRLHQTKAIRAAYLIVRDQGLAEDVSQTAFLRVFDRILQFDDRRAFGPWFYRIVINEAIKAVRHDHQWISLDEELESTLQLGPVLVDPLPGLLSIAEAEDAKRALWDALGQLAPAQRAAVVLRYYLDMRETEIAQQLARPKGTIKWLISVARNRLRALLAAESEPHNGSSEMRSDHERGRYHE